MWNKSSQIKVSLGLAFDVPISNANLDNTGYMLGSLAKYTANTGVVAISTANSGLDGSGTLGTVLTAASNGTLIKTVTIKGGVSQAGGMVRLFIYDGTNTRLLEEVEIDPSAGGKSSLYKTFSKIVLVNFFLKAGYVLKASTEKANVYYLTAESLDWVYP